MMSKVGELVKDNITGEYKHIFNHIGGFDVYLEDALKIFPNDKDAIIHNYQRRLGIKKQTSKYVYVYFISDGEFVKIGVSENINRRIKELETANSRKLKCIKKIKCNSRQEAFDLEYEFHNRFKNLQVKKEWFRISYSELYGI